MMRAMLELVGGYGLAALFVVCFCASTLLPLGSEWLLVVMLLEGSHSPAAVVAIATLGNTLGSVTSYLIGRWGSDWLTLKLLRINMQQQQQAESWFNRFGSWGLLLAWLPVIGDPLCLVSGALKTPPGRFLLLVASGKGLRYLGIALLTLQGTDLLTWTAPL